MSHGFTIGGVYCGLEVSPGLFAEEMTERRFVIRQRKDTTYAMRIGEVNGGEQFGGGKCFQATRNDGTHVAITKTFKSAVTSLTK